MPTRIEEAVYENLSDEEKIKIESDEPSFFPSKKIAVQWGFERGGFSSLEESSLAYDKIKLEEKPKTAQEMAHYWVELVRK